MSRAKIDNRATCFLFAVRTLSLPCLPLVQRTHSSHVLLQFQVFGEEEVSIDVIRIVSRISVAKRFNAFAVRKNTSPVHFRIQTPADLDLRQILYLLPLFFRRVRDSFGPVPVAFGQARRRRSGVAERLAPRHGLELGVHAERHWREPRQRRERCGR